MPLKTNHKAALIAGLAAIGTFLARWHGGGFFGGSPKVLKNILWALPFTLIAGIALFQHTNDFVSSAAWSIAAFALCLIGKATGHGGGIDMAHSDKEPDAGRELEKLEYLILWLHGRIDQYTYDAILMAITGLAASSGAVLVFSFINIPAAIIIATGGLLKAAAYMIGWAVYPKGTGAGPKEFNEATEIGEGLGGFFAYVALGIAAWMVF